MKFIKHDASLYFYRAEFNFLNDERFPIFSGEKNNIPVDLMTIFKPQMVNI